MPKLLRQLLSPFVIASMFASAAALRAADDFPPQPAVPYLTPQESLKHFQMPEGYSLELVLSEPDIKEPVVAAFDGNGRLFVAEMRTYMQNIDGKGELVPTSRISMHWSSKGDGVYDKHTVFVDNLLLPRMILPLDDRILTVETDSGDVWSYRDTDGDGVADKKELFYQGQVHRSNLEHQPSGLVWCLDNWIYTTYNAYRIRWTPSGILREPTASNGGQWGLAQGNDGKQWFVNAGGEMGPLNFQVPIVYGALAPKEQKESGYDEVYPLVPIPDVQGGLIRFRPQEKTLNHVTSSAGCEIFRGDQLPADLRGDLLFGEPVGRLIRRSKVEFHDGITQVRNAYPKSEFIRSDDPNFRPVNMLTAPDGTLFIVDMYRGIIQEGNWVNEGSYLRNVVQQYQLEKNFGRGRIWRLVHKGFKRDPQPHMLYDSADRLVNHLSNANGWWRDTAQKLLILKQDKSVVPALESMARTNPEPLARVHALWTLEGLDSINADVVRAAMKDVRPEVRVAAIRVSETLYKKNAKDLAQDIRAMAKDPDPSVVLQSVITANLLKIPDNKPFIEQVIATTSFKGVKELSDMMINPPKEAVVVVPYSAAEKKILDRGAEIYKGLCFACHGTDGKGMALEGAASGTTMAPPLGGSKTAGGHPDGIIHVLLHGLSGPVNGIKYDAQMVPMGLNDDAWIAAITSYVRNSFGNHATFITEKDVARVRAAASGRAQPWTSEELKAAVPQPLPRSAIGKMTASHKNDGTAAANDGNLATRYSTDASQAPGMWFQIELNMTTNIAGVLLDTTPSPQDYPRGYSVQLSTDGVAWGEPVANGVGDGPLTQILFPPRSAKFVKITQTGAVDGLFWSIHELRVYEQGVPLKISEAPEKTGQKLE